MNDDRKPLSMDECYQLGDTMFASLWYPRSSEKKYIEVDLIDVRAADGIRISYDFDRDGYVIEQASDFGPWELGEESDPDWQEVAFVKAWAREKKRGEP
jgi:hypothetical protein